jgi:hypothetical protein
VWLRARQGRTGAGSIGYGREGEDEYQLYGKFSMIKDAPVLQFTRRQEKTLRGIIDGENECTRENPGISAR